MGVWKAPVSARARSSPRTCFIAGSQPDIFLLDSIFLCVRMRVVRWGSCDVGEMRRWTGAASARGCGEGCGEGGAVVAREFTPCATRTSQLVAVACFAGWIEECALER